ncbi:MAG: hypothetical protein M5R36_23505 [Deltaproteobacteria bacterium]|nr:hypothetical protein [Deltaproteobacteria bacterium]
MFVKEPVTESPLFELDNVVVTPHLGAKHGGGAGKRGGGDRRADGGLPGQQRRLQRRERAVGVRRSCSRRSTRFSRLGKSWAACRRSSRTKSPRNCASRTSAI